MLPPVVRPGDTHSYYNYIFRLDLNVLKTTRAEFAAALRVEGANARDELPGPVYTYEIFQRHNFFGGRWPVRDLGLTTMDYTQVKCPEAEAYRAECIMLPINEAMTEGYVRKVAAAVNAVARRFAA